VGDDGVLLIDDGLAGLGPKLKAKVATISPKPIKFLLNTHWHGDHTGGNENLAKTGAFLVAHENVRKRMGSEQFIALFNQKVPASPEAALPVVTFAEGVSFYWNGDEVRAYHVAPAHTDGDTVVQFVKADVVHMGDCFFNGNYPFIDTSSGGKVDGVVAAAERVLAGVSDKTRIIPGHGPVASKAELQAYRDTVKAIRDRVAKLKAEGKTKEAAVAAKPSAEFDAKWGQGFVKPDVFVGIVYDSLP
jgi:cyclase